MIVLLMGLVSAQTVSPLDGGWAFMMETEGGERRAEATFKVEGTSVAGKWDKSDVKGAFADGKLDLSFPLHSEEGGFSATLKIAGELKDGEITGQWTFGQYSGPFRAKKKA